MARAAAASADPVRVGLIVAGRIGTAHATRLACDVRGADLLAVADARPGAADGLAADLGCRPLSDQKPLLADPQLEPVLITASATAHAELIFAATAEGK